MADDLVLASDVVDLDKDGNLVVVGEEGEPLPAKLKDLHDEYVESGILVPKKYKDMMDDPVLRPFVTQSGLSQQDVVQMTKADIENTRLIAEATANPS